MQLDLVLPENVGGKSKVGNGCEFLDAANSGSLAQSQCFEHSIPETEIVQAPKSVVGCLAPLHNGCHYDRATDVDGWLQPLHVVLVIAGQWSFGEGSLFSSYGLV